MEQKRGLAPIAAVMIIAAVVLLAGAGYFVYKYKIKNTAGTAAEKVTGGNEVQAPPAPAPHEVQEVRSGTYLNQKYELSFTYPGAYTLYDDKDPAKQTLAPLVLKEQPVSGDELLKLSIPAIGFNVAVKGLTGSLEDYATGAKREAELDSKDSAAGVAYSLKPITINGLSGYVLKGAETSAVGNTVTQVFLAHGGNIYRFSYVYSEAYAHPSKDLLASTDPAVHSAILRESQALRMNQSILSTVRLAKPIEMHPAAP